MKGPFEADVSAVSERTDTADAVACTERWAGVGKREDVRGLPGADEFHGPRCRRLGTASMADFSGGCVELSVVAQNGEQGVNRLLDRHG
jgi:hypothetical protein